MRHNGISLAMQQRFWDRYGVPRSLPVNHPVSEKPTDRNPVLLASSRGEVPATFDALALDLRVPGVIMEPRGVFATVLAQHSGCAYVHAR